MNDHDALERLLRLQFAAAAEDSPPSGQLASVLARVADTRQRGAWRSGLASVGAIGRVRPRYVWLVAILALLVASSVAGLVVIGARPRSLNVVVPPTVGTGLIAYAANGAIHTLDPVTGRDQMVYATHDEPLGQVTWSRDGNRILTSGVSSVGSLDSRVARSLAADGSDLLDVPTADSGAWSPDGLRYAVIDHDGVSITDARTQTKITLPGPQAPTGLDRILPDRVVAGWFEHPGRRL